MERRLLIIMNARSGGRLAGRVRRVATALFDRAGIPHEIVVTRRVRTLRRHLANAAERGFTEIVCAGGDGTISLVAQHIRDRTIPISIIPAGTGNILAKHLGIPLLLRPAIRLIIESPHLVALDAIERPDGLSVLNLSVGLSSLTMADVDTRAKRVFGTATYVAGILLYLLRRNPARFTITVDGVTRRFRAREVLIANAGFRRTAVETFFRDSDPDDGILECSVFLASGLRGMLAVVGDVLAHTTDREDRYLVRIPVHREITIESNPELPVQADGDPVGFGTVHARVRRRAILVRAPEHVPGHA